MPHPDRPLKDGRIAVWRHPAAVRIAHWLNAACLLVMLTSGLQIFNAHPALYIGQDSAFDRPVLAITVQDETVDPPVGLTTVMGRTFVTTGVLGVSRAGPGREMTPRAFPAWITLPPGQDLATARLWHFFFAWVFAVNGAAWIGYGLARGQMLRKLVPTGGELRHIGAAVIDHLRLRFPRGEAARGYNVLQKLSYLVVLAVLLPLMVATGMTMSPGLDAALPGLVQLFGGRQTARTLHFLAAAVLVAFFLAHLIMVFAAGAVNEIRSMITGRYVIDPGRPGPAP